MKNSKKKFFGYVAITLTLAVMLGASFVIQPSNADAEAVTVSENATIVTSPFTAAVQKVHGSVVGVNNYTTYSTNNNNYYNNPFNNPFFGFGFGFGGGNYGYGYGDSNPYQEEGETREVLQGTGSGVVVAKGYVLTNFHVVEDATKLEVTIDEQKYPAQLMGTDENKDLAVLFVDGLPIEPVVLGDSDVLQIGDWAICIGNPLGFSGTTTVGVISALNREISGNATDAYGKRTTNTMIQTDAAINSGNSGGGMFNVAGELIGIPSLKYSSSSYGEATIEGIGMAIPVNVAKPLINDVLAGKGNVQSAPGSQSITSGAKPRLGVTVTNMNSSHYAVANGLLPTGAYIVSVEEGSPAEKAGIQVADIVVEIDGEIIANTTEMTSNLGKKQAGDVVNVKVYRVPGGLDKVNGSDIPEGEYIDLKVELAILDEVAQ
ncbi:MAG: trypsin-like peptidase domain-containing protein [Clostridia bacterium]|nr:trypsin-like peptidase domain-containing protein [Clostridia bacterium]